MINFLRRARRLQPEPDPQTLIIQPKVEAWVERQADSVVKLHWTVPADAVEIYAHARPDNADYTAPLSVVQGTRPVSLTGLDPAQRHYFTLVFSNGRRLTVAERFLPLRSVPNVRDIGGYRTAEGRQVRWGRLYRGGDLSALTGTEADYLAQLNLKLICDLRTHKEVEERPNRLPDHWQTRYAYTPLYRRDRILRSLNALFFKRNRFGEVLRDGYLRAIDEKPHVFGDLLRRMAEADNLPLYLHCTAGKDRTGMVVALLLRLLGVPESTVIADYSLSNRDYAAFVEAAQPNVRHLRRVGISMAQLRPVLLADPTTIQAMLTHIDHRYGSVEGYVRRAAGVAEGVIEQLRENLLLTHST